MSEERCADLPDEVFNPPDLPFEYHFFITAFFDLCGDRPLGFGAIGNISWTSINTYIQATGIAAHDEDFATLVSEVIRSIDNDYVADVNKQQGQTHGGHKGSRKGVKKT